MSKHSSKPSFLKATVEYSGDSDDGGFQHSHEFTVADIEQHHKLQWSAQDEKTKVSLVEDYALWANYRRYGDQRQLQVHADLDSIKGTSLDAYWQECDHDDAEFEVIHSSIATYCGILNASREQIKSVLAVLPSDLITKGIQVGFDCPNLGNAIHSFIHSNSAAVKFVLERNLPLFTQDIVNEFASKYNFTPSAISSHSFGLCVDLTKDDKDEDYYRVRIRSAESGKVSVEVCLLDDAGVIINDGEVLDDSIEAAITNAASRVEKIAASRKLPQDIKTTLTSSENGFDDYDVEGIPCVHRVCIGQGIKKGDIFNVYCSDSVKLGGAWQGTLEKSLDHLKLHSGLIELQSIATRNLHENASVFNDAQKAVLRTYANGDFAHLCEVTDEKTLADELEHCGDGLLRFLIVELSSKEDCDSLQEAQQRIESAISQLQEVVDAICE